MRGKLTTVAKSAPRTEGLTPLDRKRAGSIADEGGTSAAVIETQRPPQPQPVPRKGGIDPDETPPIPTRVRGKG